MEEEEEEAEEAKTCTEGISAEHPPGTSFRCHLTHVSSPVAEVLDNDGVDRDNENKDYTQRWAWFSLSKQLERLLSRRTIPLVRDRLVASLSRVGSDYSQTCLDRNDSKMAVWKG